MNQLPYFLELGRELVLRYGIYVLIVLFVLAELRRLFLPRLQRWAQDQGSPWIYVTLIATLLFLQWTAMHWPVWETYTALGIAGFTVLRSFYAGFRLRHYRPPRRDSDESGPVSYV